MTRDGIGSINMDRLWQIFVAPGDKDQPLSIEGSPWHLDRWVRIPREHWDVILNFAKELDLEKGELLVLCSASLDDNDNDYVHVPNKVLEDIIHFIEKLSQAITVAPPLVPQPTEDIPDDYINEEHVRMLTAVSEVLKESLLLQQPFRAWVE